MSNPTSAPTPHALAAATEAIGGVCVPLAEALRRLGWPYRSRSAVHARRLSGTLPVVPRQLGSRWVVYACDAAKLFETGAAAIEEQRSTPASLRRGPGRPRKIAPASDVADHQPYV